MDYDYKNRASSTQYEPNGPVYRQPGSSAPASPFYPVARVPRYRHASSGTGVRVAIKPGYVITPPPQLSAHACDMPQSNFHFGFDLERNMLVEGEKQHPNWSQIVSENIPSRPAESVPSVAPQSDPVVSKYIASGLNREAVSLAAVYYGDNPTKVHNFVKGYNLLREMGFSSNSTAEALFMYDNDSEKALAHFLNNTC